MSHLEQAVVFRREETIRPDSNEESPLLPGQVLDRVRKFEAVSWRERICHLTWAWFTFPMSTGGLAILLSSTPYRFPGLTEIGKGVYIFDVVVLVALICAISIRFLLHPPSLRSSLLHPTESLFFPTFFLAVVIVLMGAQAYGEGQLLVQAERALFWVYCAVTFCLAVGQYFVLFKGEPGRMTVQSMTPGWLLPVFPVMLSGTFAGAIAPFQPPGHRETILIAGLTFQGLGWMVSFMLFAVLLHRLMQYGLPAPNLRPGLFIAVGPPSFTAIALITVSDALPSSSHYFSNQHPDLIPILQSLADLFAIFLWALAFWFFCIALLAVLAGVRKMSFHLIWYGLIFPNVGFTLATINIGQRLDSPAILWVTSGMTGLLVALWLFVFVAHIVAVIKKKILMPGLDEDKDEYKEDDRLHDIPVPPSRAPNVGESSSEFRWGEEP